MRYSAALLLLFFAACADPVIDEYEPRTGVITGTVLYAASALGEDPCVPTPARGNVIVTLFEENNLPPPDGTSSPVSFIVVPEEAFFPAGASADEGVFAAPFTFPTVASGRYQLRAFLDADGDFHPTISLLAQPTAGDVGGGYVDSGTGEFLVVEVKDDRVTSQITVTVGLPIPVERPAFTITSTPSYTVPFATPQTMTIESYAIQREQVSMRPECTAFLVQYVRDDEGAFVDANGDHLPDLYPTVILRRRNQPEDTSTVIVPAIINPLSYQARLATMPAVPTTRLDLIVPPAALETSETGSRVLNAVPPGEYDTIVISGTGQTWQIPNDLDVVQPAGGPDPSQSVVVQMNEGGVLPSGGISGRVTVMSEEVGEVYIVAFDATDPPPPEGTGEPRGLATVPRDAFTVTGPGVRNADFTLGGLAPGTYLLVAILDANDNFSPLVSLLAQPDAGDVLGGAAAPVTVRDEIVSGQQVVVGQPLAFDRPAFSFDDGIEIDRIGFPTTIRLTPHDIDALGIDSDTIPVALTNQDEDGDNLVDLRPRVLLTRMVDGGDPRTAPNDPRLTIIPGIVSPIPFLGSLAGGPPVVPADSLDIILPPVALVATASGALERVSPPPAGRYRVNVLSVTGQTWSVPNDLDVVLQRAGGPNEDPTQARFVTVRDSPVPSGAILGDITLGVPPPTGPFGVVVFAFATNDPPPPLGDGRPRAISIVPGAAFGGGTTASYALGGLTTGTYQVRAFLDANASFVPWFDPLNQPDMGDVGGGYLNLMNGTLLDVSVDALGAPATGIAVTIPGQLAYPTDRPVFSLVPDTATLRLATGSVAPSLQSLTVGTNLLTANGVFAVQWADLDGNGVADDVNGDMNPDTFPIVVADQLDPDDPTNQRLAPDPVRIPGFINPGQFVGLGFPAGDPTETQTVVLATDVDVVFTSNAIRLSDGQRVSPPPGRYRITVVGPSGRTWSIPNVLAGAVGSSPLPETQGDYLTVAD